MLGLKSNHVSKRGPYSRQKICFNIENVGKSWIYIFTWNYLSIHALIHVSNGGSQEQGISKHGIDLVRPEYSDKSDRKIMMYRSKCYIVRMPLPWCHIHVTLMPVCCGFMHSLILLHMRMRQRCFVVFHRWEYKIIMSARLPEIKGRHEQFQSRAPFANMD